MLQCGLVRANFALAMNLALSIPDDGARTTEDRCDGSLYRHKFHVVTRQHPSSVLCRLSSVIRNGAGEGNRTPVVSLEGCCSTIELHPQASGVAGGGGWIRTNVG